MAAPSSSTSPLKQTISVSVLPTTGGQIDLKVSDSLTIIGFKKIIGNKLKIARNRIVLLLKNKQLSSGTLASNRVTDGARLTLLPSVETGLSASGATSTTSNVAGSAVHHRSDVRHALETLSEQQVDNFLNGKAPLNLTMRVGDHLMFIQLQLSAGITTPPQTPTSPAAPCSLASASTLPPSPPPSPAAFCHRTPQVSTAGATPKAGAVIETMYHHGSGVYSGTFSGTLSHALQDRNGRPRRDTTTILHILNDLLGATSVQPSAPPTPPAPITNPDKELENSVTRGKVAQLQTMLELRRKLRRERKRFSPYPSTSRSSSPSTLV